LVDKPEGKRPLGRPQGRWEHNINIISFSRRTLVHVVGWLVGWLVG